MLDLTVQDFNGEPRMRDVDIAEALGFEQSMHIGEMISQCADRLVGLGEMVCRELRQTSLGGRPGKEYWLNEHQAFYLCTQTETERAIEVMQRIVNVFVAWRHERLGEHAQPQPSDIFEATSDTHTQLALISEARLLFGHVAGRMMWRSVGFPDLPVEPTEQTRASSAETATQGDEVLSFLHEHFVFTGKNSDFIRSKTIYEVYSAFMDGEPSLAPRALAIRLHELAKGYRCPSSGARFWPAKSNHTGYRGLRLIT
ncbi:hypothetical protein [Tritonibacter mobilis]|uniref:Uncharacterized protein n=1 Tax=Tritonibacter mobilis F1926 TaxID=1265309 RepID=A0A1B1A8N8_9RHOB|nr:hypothetical protein [Tritonibacter mobilis]ANP42923.1 hypothetical protein K529_019355 [Tritonibacter mobilis F1926]KJZ23263.1 hypothetical protein TW79_13250 [Tritonibacter mobilis]